MTASWLSRVTTQTLVIKRMAALLDDLDQPELDDYGQPTVPAGHAGEQTLATVQGLIQPRGQSASPGEANRVSQAGTVVADHVAFMDFVPGLGTDCWIEHAGGRYDVTFIQDAAGIGHHLEVELRRVDARQLVEPLPASPEQPPDESE